MIRESFTLIYKMHLRLPSRFALLDKTLATLGSVGTELYPDFNVFEVAEPYATELVAAATRPRRCPTAAAREMRELRRRPARAARTSCTTRSSLFRDGEIEVAGAATTASTC